MDDLLDADYISAASQIVAKNLLKTEVLPSNYHFKINANGGRFKIITNINFDEINRIQKGKSSATEDYSPAHVASELFNASYGLILAAHYGGDFYTSEINSNIIKLKNKHILSRTSCNKSVQNNFYTILLNGSPDVATTLNSGNRSFEEFLELLVKANRFKKWLKSKSPDENLISNYMQDITSSGWLNQSKGKFFRYVISNGAGFISPIGGLIFSAIDSFAIDKINFGWKPNQFINGNLKNFIDNK